MIALTGKTSARSATFRGTEAALRWRLTRSAAKSEFGRNQIGATFGGYTSATSDGDSNQTALREYAPEAADAGSAIFNTVNPAQTRGLLFYKFNIQSFTLEAGFGTTFTGSNSASGTTILAGLQYQIGGIEKSGQPHVERKSDETLFHEDVKDEVNHDLFSPAKEDPVGPAPTPLPLKIKAKPTPSPRTKIDDELNKTEMQLELKSKKTDE